MASIIVGMLVPAVSPSAAAPAAVGSPVAVAEPARPAQPAPTDTSDGLRAEVKTTFVVDTAAQAIHAATEATLTNQKADVPSGGGVQQFFFLTYAVPVLSEATHVTAQKADGSPLQVDVHAAEGAAQDWVKVAEIDLDPRLNFNESQAIRLSYDLPYQAPRSPGLSRANDALVMFPAFSPGDSGITDIEVRIPAGFAIEVVGSPLEQQEADGQVVLSHAAIEDPDDFTAIVVATDNDRLTSQTVDVDGRPVEVRAWPGDSQWSDFVSGQLGAVMPALTELIGQPWPTERGLQVIETASPYAHGYAGWYSQTDHSISLGDQLDATVIAHELSHVWFNADLFDARWINEGFADEYAETTLTQVKPDAPPPGAAQPDRAAGGAVALNDWTTPSLLEQQDDATETYGYAASWWVVDQVADEIGVEKLRAVIDAVAHDEIGYAGDPKPETVEGVANWQRLLDQLQNLGGSQKARDLFATWVVSDDQRALLDARDAARLAYSGVAERGDGWTPPLELRRAMSDWRFGEVDEIVADAQAVLDVRDAIDRALDGREVGDLDLEEAYESASELDDVTPVARATLEAAESFRDAERRYDGGSGVLGTLGLAFTGIDDRMDDAAEALSDGDPQASLDASADVQAQMDGAGRMGVLRLVILLLLGGAVFVVSRRRLAMRLPRPPRSGGRSGRGGGGGAQRSGPPPSAEVRQDEVRRLEEIWERSTSRTTMRPPRPPRPPGPTIPPDR